MTGRCSGGARPGHGQVDVDHLLQLAAAQGHAGKAAPPRPEPLT